MHLNLITKDKETKFCTIHVGLKKITTELIFSLSNIRQIYLHCYDYEGSTFRNNVFKKIKWNNLAWSQPYPIISLFIAIWIVRYFPICTEMLSLVFTLWEINQNKKKLIYMEHIPEDNPYTCPKNQLFINNCVTLFMFICVKYGFFKSQIQMSSEVGLVRVKETNRAEFINVTVSRSYDRAKFSWLCAKS